jgi:hypothetical protein
MIYAATYVAPPDPPATTALIEILAWLARPESRRTLKRPLTDSNRRPPLYEEGPWVKFGSGGGVRVRERSGGVEQRSSLYRLLGGRIRLDGRSLR